MGKTTTKISAIMALLALTTPLFYYGLPMMGFEKYTVGFTLVGIACIFILIALILAFSVAYDTFKPTLIHWKSERRIRKNLWRLRKARTEDGGRWIYAPLNDANKDDPDFITITFRQRNELEKTGRIKGITDKFRVQK